MGTQPNEKAGFPDGLPKKDKKQNYLLLLNKMEGKAQASSRKIRLKQWGNLDRKRKRQLSMAKGLIIELEKEGEPTIRKRRKGPERKYFHQRRRKNLKAYPPPGMGGSGKGEKGRTTIRGKDKE